MKAIIANIRKILMHPIILPPDLVKLYEQKQANFLETCKQLWLKLRALLGISILAAILWRTELTLRWGWESMEWFSNFHYSSILISLLFAAWMYRCAPCVPDRLRLLRSFLIFFGGLGLYLTYGVIFQSIFGTWGDLIWFLYATGMFSAFVGIPIFICMLARLFSYGFHPAIWLLVPMLMLNSTFALGPIYGVESGIILIGFVFAGGLPFALSKNSAPEQQELYSYS